MLEHKKHATEERTAVILLKAFKENFIILSIVCFDVPGMFLICSSFHTWQHKAQNTEIFLPSETKVNIPVWSEHYRPVLFIFCKDLGPIRGRKFTPVQTLWRLKKTAGIIKCNLGIICYLDHIGPTTAWGSVISPAHLASRRWEAEYFKCELKKNCKHKNIWIC